MKNNKLFFKIYISLLIITFAVIIVLSILGNKTRIGYIGELKFDINNTLKLNGFDEEKTKELFTIGDELNLNNLINYIFTNQYITNYSYSFRLNYYDKVFRNSDIYSVYADTNKILQDYNFIKNIDINNGSPFGILISDKIIDYDKIDNINYTLKVKLIIYLSPILILIALFFIYDFIKTLITFNYKKISFSFIKHKSEVIKLNPEYITSYIIFFPFIILMYQSLNLSFPYYYAWDSTRIFSTDILLVSSNIMPEHFFHPNMIPLVLMKYIFIPIGKLLGIISISNIKELETSFNPYLQYVEFTEYILNLVRLIFLLYTTFMYINIVKIMKIHKIYSNKIFLFFISLLFLISSTVFTNMVFMNNVIRYELMGILLSSISLYFILLASEQEDISSKKHIFYLILSGVFSGCAILSKILLVFLSAVIFISYIILNLSKYTKIPSFKFNFYKISKILTFVIVAFLFIDILVFSGITIKTAFRAPKYNLQLLSIQLIILSYFIILLVLTILLYKNKIILRANFKLFIYNFSIFVISFLSPLLLSFSLPNGHSIFILTYINSYSGYNTVLSYGNDKFALICFILITGIVFSVFTLFILNKKQNIQNKINEIISKKYLLIKILLSLFLIFISFAFSKMLRNDGRDNIISYSMILISFFIFIRNIIFITKFKKIFITILSIILTIYSVSSLYRFKKYSSEFLTKSAYVYTKEEWKNFTYGLNATRFVSILEKSYETEEAWNTSFYWSRNIKQTERLLKQVNITNNSLKDSIIANNNSKVSIDGIYKISNIDENLKGSLILKLSDITNNIFLRADYDFYFISDTEYKKYDNRIIYSNYDFYINDKKYFVYSLNMNSWGELKYGYNGNFSFIKGIDFNDGFILISDKLSKGL